MTGSTPYGLSEENLQKLQDRHQQTLTSIKVIKILERVIHVQHFTKQIIFDQTLLS